MPDVARYHTPAFLVLAFALAVGWLVAGLSADSLPVIAALGSLVLILGLPHGALDLWVAAKQARWGREGQFTARGVLRFHVEYLVLAGLVAASFALMPTVALVGFLVLSLWHFADDWPGLPTPVRLGCASVVVLVPTLFHPSAVAEIFAAVTGRAAPDVVSVPYPFFLVSAWVLIGSIGVAASRDRRAGAEVAGLAVLAAALPPLVFFAVYFTLLHGPRHLLRHGGLVRGRGGRGVLIGYTVAAIGIVALFGAMLGRTDDLSLSSDALRAVFAGLAALTVPHAILMEVEKRRGHTDARVTM